MRPPARTRSPGAEAVRRAEPLAEPRARRGGSGTQAAALVVSAAALAYLWWRNRRDEQFACLLSPSPAQPDPAPAAPPAREPAAKAPAAARGEEPAAGSAQRHVQAAPAAAPGAAPVPALAAAPRRAEPPRSILESRDQQAARARQRGPKAHERPLAGGGSVLPSAPPTPFVRSREPMQPPSTRLLPPFSR